MTNIQNMFTITNDIPKLFAGPSVILSTKFRKKTHPSAHDLLHNPATNRQTDHKTHIKTAHPVERAEVIATHDQQCFTSSVERQLTGLINNNNNNDRLTAFDPGQPG